MMSKKDNLERMLSVGIVAVVRANTPEGMIEIARALKKGGVDVVEITMTTPGALEIIKDVSTKLGREILTGVGSVTDPETAEKAIGAGAQFVVGPVLNYDVIKICQKLDKVCVPGTFTPTEILSAWNAGADLVKVFPTSLGGPGYVRAVLAPLPGLKLVPTGGVRVENAGEFIKAGAAALAVGGNLVSKKAVAEKDWNWITKTAGAFVTEIKKARG
jgi:2-dehydro-3-deoxyphosphogluconate aldolase/(4S)-4-hydroxy-2-oxoglutarate aldolase